MVFVGSNFPFATVARADKDTERDRSLAQLSAYQIRVIDCSIDALTKLAMPFVHVCPYHSAAFDGQAMGVEFWEQLTGMPKTLCFSGGDMMTAFSFVGERTEGRFEGKWMRSRCRKEEVSREGREQ